MQMSCEMSCVRGFMTVCYVDYDVYDIIFSEKQYGKEDYSSVIVFCFYTSMRMLTGQWSDPKMSVWMVASVTFGISLSDTTK